MKPKDEGGLCKLYHRRERCMTFIALKSKGAKCTSAEVNKCHASQARKYPVGTATMDTFRRQENQKRDKLILHKIVPRSHSLSQLLNVDRTSDRLKGVV